MAVYASSGPKLPSAPPDMKMPLAVARRVVKYCCTVTLPCTVPRIQLDNKY